MNKEQFLSLLKDMDSVKKAQLVLRVGHVLTVIARGYYDNIAIESNRLFIQINEIQHRLTSFAGGLIGKGFAPDDDYLADYFAAICEEIPAIERLSAFKPASDTKV